MLFCRAVSPVAAFAVGIVAPLLLAGVAQAQSTTVSVFLGNGGDGSGIGFIEQFSGGPIDLVLTSGVESGAQSLGGLSAFSYVTGNGSATIDRTAVINETGFAQPTNSSVSYSASSSFDGSNSTVSYGGGVYNFTLPSGGNLRITLTGGSSTPISGPQAGVDVQGTFLYTASAAAVSAPEPGSVAFVVPFVAWGVGSVIARRKR